ncbi:methyl-accepting chemotaxis protein McpB [Clostridium tepidiprofundi DSM 19306]|uniref:Methyl-accepting chemotaxis protein McpB n=1 Tax=Clostridium tepidiprofundi DSM 19306 TaxID=1121338 RepID=A0A151B3X7_9CLOT|nr:methyl-accepting chemotaxis protein [Clostridium tepidiprofundi]KYH34621.1 methyl-accepting chemotaxis protein McpB [Clostridium tepidiprofundi DSM 19306]
MKIKRSNSMNMRKKLILIFICVLMFPILIIGIISNVYIREKLRDDFVKSSEKQIILADKSINAYFESIKENVKFMANDLMIKKADYTITKYVNKTREEDLKMTPSLNGGIEQGIYERFLLYAKTHPRTAYVYLGLENGGYIQWPEETILKNYDPRKRPYYIAGMKNKGNVTITEPYYWEPIQSAVISTVTTVKDESGNIIGVLGIDANLKGITEMIKNIKIGDSGYLILTDSKGKIIADAKDSNLNFKDISELKVNSFNNLKNIKNDNFEISLDNKKYIANIVTSPQTNWKYIALIPYSEVMRTANNIRNIIIVLSLISIVISILVAYIFSNRISKPLENTANYLQIIESGDFTHNIPEIILKRKDEIGKLVGSVDSMKTNIASLIKGVKDTTGTVKETSDFLMKMANDTEIMTRDISQAIEQIALSATDQANSLEVGVIKTNELADQIIMVKESTNEIEKISNSNSELSEKGLSVLSSLISKSNEVKDYSNKINEMVTDMSNMSNKIGTITETIWEIAEQTNLLSLNAAIEAARAGEQGKGFAVVANEVKKLAEESSNAAKDIKKLIESMQIQVSDIVSTVQNTNIIIADQDRVVNDTENIFEDITTHINMLKLKIEEVKGSYDEMEEKKEKLVEVIENISAISEETAASAEEVSASASEQKRVIEQVSSYSENLNKLSENLQEKVNYFKI